MVPMNRFTMVLQALIVSGLLGIVLVIGYNQQDKEYIKYTKELKLACQKYMEDNRTKLKFNETTLIFIKDLLDKEYIKEVKEEYCIYSVSYTKGLLFGKYKANKDCDIKDEEENESLIENETVLEE